MSVTPTFSRFLHKFFVSTWLLFSVVIAAAAAQERVPTLANIYQLSPEFITHWNEQTNAAQDDADILLPQLDAQIAEITDIREQLYAQLQLVAVMITLEQTPKAKEYLQSLETSVKELNDPTFHALFQSQQARALFNSADYAAALELTEAALAHYLTLQEPSEILKNQFLLAQIYYHQGKVKLALDEYLAIYAITKQQPNGEFHSKLVASIAQVYSNTGDHEKAIEFYKESLGLINIEQQKFYASVVLFNIGVAYEKVGDYDNAQDYLTQALNLSIELNDDIGKAYVWRELGEISGAQSRHQQAIRYFTQAYQVVTQAQDLRMMTSLNIQLTENYHALNNVELTNQHLELAINQAQQLNVRPALLKVHQLAAEVFSRQQAYAKAFQHQQRYTELLKEKFDEENASQLSELKVKFDSETKAAKNKLLQQENSLKQLELAKQQTQQQLMWVSMALVLIAMLAVLMGLRSQVRARKRFKAMAMTDELTGAPNRRHILEYARRQLSIAQDSQNDLIIAMLDLDKFKAINDQFGHDVGDAVLIHFYQSTQAKLRNLDRLGRFGGEEWLLVMPGTASAQMHSIFEKIRQAINAAPIDGLPENYRLTFSMGVAHVQTSDDLDSLIKRADEAVYQAKAQGRDRCIESA